MRARDAVRLLLILLDFMTYVCLLPAPGGVYMESVDMAHTLRWRPPLTSACNTTLEYSVQFQGEFELVILNGRWVDALECQKILHPSCKVTCDLGSDSDYSLRVRAQCGSRVSAWTRLAAPFNRRDTVLTVPKMAVTAVGDALHVSFDELPLIATISVTVWKRGEEEQAAVHVVPAQQTALHVSALQEGAVYCATAQALLDTNVSSSSTDAQCVSITGSFEAWKKPTAVACTVLAMAGLLFAALWSLVHSRPDACCLYFRTEPFPGSLLIGDQHILVPVSARPEVEELCDPILVVSVPGPEPAEGQDPARSALTSYYSKQ
ncbi:interleukin-20 receptor subunit beta [Genypterus blacodes]|uniref:interleukin-20 receptor subunit beta n=1 Tax=Genypterus blacodes TaxID=154954 RepID=UPI003F75A281